MLHPLKKYLLRSTLTTALLVLIFWLEHSLVSNTPKQIQNQYQQVQEVIHAKEILFGSVYAQACKDTSNIEKRWVDLNALALRENIILNIARNDTLLLWTSNLLNPKTIDKPANEGTGFLYGPNGFYLGFYKKTGSYTFHWYYLIRSNFNYQNQYLENRFSDELQFLGSGVISPSPIKEFYDVVSADGAYLFSVQIFAAGFFGKAWLIWAWSIALLFFIISFHQLCSVLLKTNLLAGLVFFPVLMWPAKNYMLTYHAPSFLYALELFSPEIYASSDIIPSLGDFLIVSLLLFWYVLLIDRSSVFNRTEPNPWLRYLKLTGMVLLATTAIDSAIDSTHSLVFDSQISFSLKNIYNLNIYTFFGIVITVLLVTIIHLCVKTCYLFFRQNKWNTWLTGLAILIIVFIVHKLIIQFGFGRGNMYYIGSTVVAASFLLFDVFLGKTNRFQHYFFLVILISFVSSYALNYYSNHREYESRKLFANKLISQNDITTEYFLKDIERKLAAEKQIKYYFLNPISVKSQFDKRMRQLYFTGYLSKYEISFYDYDSAYNHFKERNLYSCDQLNYILRNLSVETINKHFRYLKTNTYLKGYLAKFPVRAGSNLLGYLFIHLQPKLIQDENRFDELQIEGYRINSLRKYEYSYAIYKDKVLISQSGDYPYRTLNTWNGEARTYKQIEDGGFSHLVFNDNQQQTVVVSKKANAFFEPLGLFSLVFTFFITILIGMLALYALFNSRFIKKAYFLKNSISSAVRRFINEVLYIKDPDVVYIRTRIQVSIILIVFITLCVTAYVTIRFVTLQYNEKQNEKLSKKIRNVANTMEGEASEMIRLGKATETAAYINQLADFYDTDISIYNREGELLASSITKVYDARIISGLMNPEAYFHLNYLKESQYNQSERIASFAYLAAYVPIFRNEQELIGYAQLPYFSKQADLLSEISSIVVGFINLFAVIFIVIGVVAYLISRNISYPLVLIQRQLATTALGKKNEPILWHRNDEIGELVEQYNRMIEKLEESAQKLAQSEREGAWRDIARQIAHEIKNPLTPMKLSIQHLQRSWADKSPKLDETLARVSKTLITQIDTLSELADEFSNFAKMPTPEYENISLRKLLQQNLDLYRVNQELEITLDCEEGIEVYFDANYLNRTLTNLIKNAIQAVTEGTKPVINLWVEIQKSKVLLHVRDNGAGIDPADAAKIFTPYYSTKIYGMGLGLPMVKNMVEAAGGRIDFISEKGKGTTFTVTLPIANVSNHDNT